MPREADRRMNLIAAPKLDSIVGGRYRVIRELGRGGMGVVLEAENTVTLKRVAIKCLHPLSALQTEARERLVREARASARVRHPNVVDVYDVVTENGLVFLVMELLEGESLGELMERNDAPLSEVLRLLIDAMRGVASAHVRGVVHRDIKPENIFLVRVPEQTRPYVKVLDFGISKLLDPEHGLSTSSGVVGTPLYMSWEQLCNVRDIDQRADVYAFGVILYQATTGRRPFEAESFPELAMKIMQETAPLPRTLRPDLPEALERVIVQAIAKDREQRTPTLSALIQALQAAIAGQGTDTDPFGRTLRDPARLAADSVTQRSTRVRSVLYGVIALSVLGLGGYLLLRAATAAHGPEEIAGPGTTHETSTHALEVSPAAVAPLQEAPQGTSTPAALAPPDTTPAAPPEAAASAARKQVATPAQSAAGGQVGAGTQDPHVAQRHGAANSESRRKPSARPVQAVPVQPLPRDATPAQPQPRLRAGSPERDEF
jgi:serine/threonine protein kinase